MERELQDKLFHRFLERPLHQLIPPLFLQALLSRGIIDSDQPLAVI